jgi:hypothetical protein
VKFVVEEEEEKERPPLPLSLAGVSNMTIKRIQARANIQAEKQACI